MRTQRRLLLTGLAIGMLLGGGSSGLSQDTRSAWEQALEWADPHDLLKESLFPEVASSRRQEWGQWYLRLSIRDAWVEFPVEIGILGGIRGTPSRLTYRTMALLGTREQLALQHLRRPTESQEILASDWLVEELVFGEGENASFDPVVLIKELRAMKGEILPVISVDRTSRIGHDLGKGEDIRFGMGGTPRDCPQETIG